jgi:hypothetical protein
VFIKNFWISEIFFSGEVLKTKIYKEESEYQGISIKSISDERLIVLSWKYFPYEIAVFYINADLKML